MFLKQKKGSLISLTTLVLIIIAIIMILNGGAFISKLLGLFLPNADKSTLKSFDSVYTIISAQSISMEDYESITSTIYLREGYQMLLLKDSELYTISNAKAYAPSICEKGKMCLCLYKDTPPALGTEEKDKARDENVVKCKSIENPLDKSKMGITGTFAIDSKWQSVNGVISLTAKPYNSYIFIRYINYSWDIPRTHLYILENNETNQDINKELSIPVCKTREENDLCFGKKKDDIVEANDSYTLSKIYTYCFQQKEGVTYNSLGVLCEYPPLEKDCQPDCSYLDTRDFCDKYQGGGCEGFNQLKKEITSSINIKYVSTENTENFQRYSLCVQDLNFCNVNNDNGCSVDTLNVYACKNSNSGAVEDPNPTDNLDKINTNCLVPNKTTIPDLDDSGCNVNFLKYDGKKIQVYYENHQTSFITSYDINNNKCKEYMDNNFYESVNLMTCKQGKDLQCQKFIAASSTNCELKFISQGKSYWLTHYSLKDEDCKKGIEELFTKVYLCRSVSEMIVVG